jgi:protein tyrosine/serine phosphatase
LAVALCATIGGWLAYQAMRPGHHGVSAVQEGVLYRSGQLSPEALAAEIHRRGIKTVVNLTDHEEAEEHVCRQNRAAYLHMPVGDCWHLCGCAAPGSQGPPLARPFDLTPLWKLLDDPHARPVLVHCTGGVHRTGVCVALYRIERQGWDPQQAIDEMDHFGFESGKPKYSNVLEFLRGRRTPSEHMAQGPAAGVSH